MPNFANRLKQIRIERKVTQKELAAYLNVSQNAIFNWENGKREPPFETIIKIADYFEVSPTYIMGWESDIESLCGMTTFQDEIEDYTQELGEFLYYNPQHKALFDASMEVKPQDVNLAKEMLDRINGKAADQPRRNEQLNAAHKRTDIEIPDGVDTSENDIMDDEDL